MAISREPLAAFVWGRGGAKLTPEEIAKRLDAEQAKAGELDFSPVGHWTQGLARVLGAAGGAYRRHSLGVQQGENDTYNKGLVDALMGGSSGAGGDTGGSGVPVSGAADELAATSPAVTPDMTGNDVYSGFMDTVKAGGVTNPYALAAVAATGNAESKWSPQNVNRRWSDPSERGVAGTSGAILSWRDGRLSNLEKFAKEAGEDARGISPATQARFFLQENPALIERLNNAKSVEEAQGLMNEAWKFAGWNRPGGEAARRLSLARGYLPSFQNAGEVASADPNEAFGAVMPEVAAATPSLADEVAEFEQTPEYSAQFPAMTGNADAQAFDAGRFGDTAAVPQDRAALAAALAGGNAPASGQGEAVGSVPAVAVAEVPQTVNASQQGYTPTARRAINPAILQALSDPRANAQTRGLAELLMRQELADQERMDARDNWLFQQDYTRRQQEADPLRAIELETARAKLDALRNPKQEQTAEMQNLTWRAKQAGLQPGTPEYADFMRTGGKNDGQTINVNTGEGDKFYKTLDEKNAQTFATISEEGLRGRSKMAQIDRLGEFLANAPTGGLAALKLAAGEYGIKTDDLNDLQAAEALINELVPQQRQPGSGTMSDADLALFKRSLPRIINQPGGNEMILQTMRGITEYQIKMGQFADLVADREMTPKEAREAIRALPNPLEQYTKAVRNMENDEQDAGWKEFTPGVRVRRVN